MDSRALTCHMKYSDNEGINPSKLLKFRKKAENKAFCRITETMDCHNSHRHTEVKTINVVTVSVILVYGPGDSSAYIIVNISRKFNHIFL